MKVNHKENQNGKDKNDLQCTNKNSGYISYM